MEMQSFVRFDGRYCVYRATPALGCGIAAAMFVLSGQAAVTAASGCFGRCRAPRRGVVGAHAGRAAQALRRRLAVRHLVVRINS